MALPMMCCRWQTLAKHFAVFFDANVVLNQSKFLKFPNSLLSETRNFYSSERPGKQIISDLFKPRQPQSFQKYDGFEQDYELVYFSSAHRYLKGGILGVYLITFPTWIVTGRFILDAEFRDPENFQGSMFLESVYDLMGVTVTSWLLMICIVSIVNKYPLRIYYHEKTQRFVFVFQKLIPYFMNKMECFDGEMKKADKHHVLGEYIVRGRQIYLKGSAFRTPYYYNRLMGYTKGV